MKKAVYVYKQNSQSKKRDVEEQNSHSAAVYWQGCLNPRELDLNFPMEYDSPPGVAASPPREPGAPPQEPGVQEMSQDIWSTGVEARPRGLSRFDTPPLGDHVAAYQAPPSRVSALHDAFPRMPSDSPLVECLLHSLEMAHSPDVSGVAAGAWAPNDWETPVAASKSVFIPSGLKNAASSLESSRVVQVGISSPQHEHAPVQYTGEKGRFSLPQILGGWDNTPPVAPAACIQVNDSWGCTHPGCRLHASGICPIPCTHPLPKCPLRTSVKTRFLVACIRVKFHRCKHPYSKSTLHVLIRLNRFYHLGKNRNRSNRFFAIYCDFLRFFAIFCDSFLEIQIRHREKTKEDCKDLHPSMVSLLGPF